MTYQGMTCPLLSEESIDVLLDYAAGRLDQARSTLLERHTASCESCAAFLGGQTSLWQTLDEWEPATVSMDFNRRLWRRIDGLRTQPWYRRFSASVRLGGWKPAIPLAAAVLVVAAGFIMDHQNTAPVSPPAGKSGGVSVIEVDQVEKTLDDIQLLKQLDTSGTDTRAARTL